MGNKVSEHPCAICEKPTTNPVCCSQTCGQKHGRLRSKPAKERFFNFIPNRPKGQCWHWIGAKSKGGYGLISKEGTSKKIFAHRLAWEIFKGPIPEGHIVVHRCENFDCVNPEHLLCGPHKIKGKVYRVSKPHARWGDENKHTKMSDAHVRFIRRAHSMGRNDLVRLVADQLGMDRSYVLRVAKGKARTVLPIASADIASTHRSGEKASGFATDKTFSLTKTQELSLPKS